MAWCAASDVREHAKQIKDPPWTDIEVGKRITRAETVLKSIFVPLYGKDEVDTWVDSGVPALVKDICSYQVAAYVMADAYGEAQMEAGTPGAKLQEMADSLIGDLKNRRRYLLDADGVEIEPLGDAGRIGSTTIDSEATFTMGERMQDSTQPGSLDGW